MTTDDELPPYWRIDDGFDRVGRHFSLVDPNDGAVVLTVQTARRMPLAEMIASISAWSTPARPPKKFKEGFTKFGEGVPTGVP